MHSGDSGSVSGTVGYHYFMRCERAHLKFWISAACFRPPIAFGCCKMFIQCCVWGSDARDALGTIDLGPLNSDQKTAVRLSRQ